MFTNQAAVLHGVGSELFCANTTCGDILKPLGNHSVSPFLDCGKSDILLTSPAPQFFFDLTGKRPPL